MRTVYPLTTDSDLTLQQVGGKGLALIEMTRAGMPVPPGLVLSVNFFRPWLDSLLKS